MPLDARGAGLRRPLSAYCVVVTGLREAVARDRSGIARVGRAGGIRGTSHGAEARARAVGLVTDDVAVARHGPHSRDPLRAALGLDADLLGAVGRRGVVHEGEARLDGTDGGGASGR